MVVSEPFRSTARRNSAGKFVNSLFLSNAFKMQWSCTPSPSTSVRCVSLFYMHQVLHAAGSWKSDYHNNGKLKFFVLEEKQNAGAKDPKNIATEKATVEFPCTVSVFLPCSFDVS